MSTKRLPITLWFYLILLAACSRPPAADVGHATATPTATITPRVESKLMAEATSTTTSTAKLQPLPNVSSPPPITTKKLVRMITDAGELQIEVYPEIAPNAAQRFLELVKIGFYDNTPIFRVVKTPRPFVAQFGINWRKNFAQWRNQNFNDDPSYYKLSRGTLAFAKAGPNTNSTQVFINYADNSFLASKQNGGFTTFALVVKGMEIADKWKTVGNPSMGLNQDELWTQGEKYLKSLPTKPNMILKMEIVK